MSRLSRPQKRAEWRKRVRRFTRSKLSVSEFCRQNKVSVPSFYYWRRKLADTEPDASQREVERAAFIPVQVATVATLQVIFPNGTRLELPSQDHELVRVSIESVARAQTTQGGA
jgi:hypothetical protein